jgi:hypothetical protein
MPPKGLIKGSLEMKEYMANLRNMRGKNKVKGKGIMQDVGNFVKDKVLKPGASMLLDEVSNLVPTNIGKKVVRGTIKSVTGLGLRKRKGMGLMPPGY